MKKYICVFFAGLGVYLAQFFYISGKNKQKLKQAKEKTKDNEKANKIRRNNSSLSRTDLLNKLYKFRK